MRIVAWLLVVVGLVLTVLGVVAALGQASSGAQPWSNELSDNFVFIKALPFVLAFGVAVGLLMARTYGPKVRSDGAVRRWSPGTVFGHWLLTLGFVLALPTGMWQYLGGILDVNLPIPLYLFYRVHYIGASIVLLAVAAFVSYLWMTGDRSLLVPRGQWARHLLGLAYELPPRVRGPYAKLLRIDLSHPRPPAGKFTFYEKVVEFPSWSIVLVLITITGLVKAARYLVPVPGLVLWLASTLHVAAMVVIVIKLLDHFRYTFPRWPLMASMATTWVREGSPPAQRQGAAERGGSAAGVVG
ncbi:MAG: cytochrome b/b6 domain-containing protein, partial [Chloroflexota bacterium]|nr:cytochrome b/b6 domain-containing protein [Chloroflexota bacterium]